MCLNRNYNYLTTIFRSILTQIYVFLVLFTIFHFDLKKFISKNINIYFSATNFEILAENNSKYCSRIIVAHVHAALFSIVLPACHNIANGIKEGLDGGPWYSLFIKNLANYSSH